MNSLNEFPGLVAFAPRARARHGQIPKPVPPCSRYPQLAGRLFLRQANEKAKFHHFGRARVHSRQSIQRFIQREQLIIRHRRRRFHRIDIHAFQVSAPFQRFFLPRAVHENAAHRLSRRAEKVSTILKLPLLLWRNEPQPGFMHQSGRLQRVPWSFISHFVCRQSSQFLVHERQQLTGGRRLASLSGFKNAREFAHNRSLLALLRQQNQPRTAVQQSLLTGHNHEGSIPFTHPLSSDEMRKRASKTRTSYARFEMIRSSPVNPAQTQELNIAEPLGIQ